MHDYRLQDRVFFIVSAVLALMLTILPLPATIAWWRPDWVLLVLLFWLCVAPNFIGIGWFFLMGIIQDFLRATPLGMHAIVYLVLVYVLTRLPFRLSVAPLWQQTLLLLIVSVVNALFYYTVMSFVVVNMPFHLSLLPVITNCVLWPWLYWLMYSVWKKRLRVY